MTKTICDVCGKECWPKHSSASGYRLKWYAIYYTTGSAEADMDICEGCFKAIRDERKADL